MSKNKERCFSLLIMWRGKMDLAEPDRVELCVDCIKAMKDAWPPKSVKFYLLKQMHAKRILFPEDFDFDE